MTAPPLAGRGTPPNASATRGGDLASIVWALGLLALFVGLRANFSHPWLNMDEGMPMAVSQAMTRRGVVDPDWAFPAENPPSHQYNFYLYNIVAHGVLRLTAGLHVSPYPTLRVLNLMFQLAALALTLDALRRIGIGRFSIARAGVLIAVAPGLVQDTGLVRPESFLYLLSALFVWTLALPLSGRWRIPLLIAAALAVGTLESRR